MVRQISVFVENKAGSLGKVTSAIREAGISIRAVASFDTPEFGIMRIIVDQPDEALEVLKENGFIVRIGNVMAVELEDRQGSLDEVLEVLSGGNISINYIYSFVIRQGRAPVMVMHTDDMTEANQILSHHNIKVIEEKDLI
jgi:hypothetical protein